MAPICRARNPPYRSGNITWDVTYEKFLPEKDGFSPVHVVSWEHFASVCILRVRSLLTRLRLRDHFVGYVSGYKELALGEPRAVRFSRLRLTMADVREDHQSVMSDTVDEKLDIEKTATATVQDVVTEFDDPNIDKDAVLFEDDSPYPEVRSAVANTDDPLMPVSSLRVWVLGLIWAVIIPGMNQFFFFRFPSVTVSGIVAQLISFPIGRAWARFMPKVKIFGIALNPGPFNVKEHVLITIMASVGAGSAYATDIVAVQRVYYNQIYSFGYQWMVVMSTQLIGFSIGGIARRFLVQPPSMIWPANLVTCALFNTLHSQTYAAWLFGYTSGLGMSLITFDWAQIAYIGSPLATPWWAEANIAVGFVFFFWIITPVLYYTNTWFSAFMPISSRTSFDRFGQTYDVTKIINEDASLNIAKYEAYSPLFLSTTFAMSYGLSFASITATLTHTFLYFRKQIWVQSRRSMSEQPDIHARLMSKYPQVPEWWYGIIFVVMFVFGIISIEVWDTQFPVWAFVLSLIISFVYTIPIGMIQAITNQQIGLNVITELVIG
ncbi:Sexual differentiation process protein isp4 [Grifola frondosa]|uniref:Sexual differentiation process protein isp4 n=1 Tax=Grifola frondosa TaxID=5627 RepID=A0A1C7LRB9_GRIFR|nr:Sexual differentiation process protein isp4 [Grifola frondosa]